MFRVVFLEEIFNFLNFLTILIVFFDIYSNTFINSYVMEDC